MSEVVNHVGNALESEPAQREALQQCSDLIIALSLDELQAMANHGGLRKT